MKYVGCYYTPQDLSPNPTAPQGTGTPCSCVVQKSPSTQWLKQPDLKIYRFHPEEASQLSKKA